METSTPRGGHKVAARTLPESPIHGLIGFTRELVERHPDPAERPDEIGRAIEVNFETVDRLLEREIDRMPLGWLTR